MFYNLQPFRKVLDEFSNILYFQMKELFNEIEVKIK